MIPLGGSGAAKSTPFFCATTPIPGTTRRKHLEENVAAMDLVLLPQEIEALSAALPPGAASGLRYLQAAMNSLNR